MAARPDGLLPHQPGIERFGYRHRWLRELGRGWQLVETSSPIKPVPNDFSTDADFPAGAVQLALNTGSPVFVADVNDGCASLHTATPDGLTCLAHVPDPTEPCIGQEYHCPAPVGRPVDDVVADLMMWANAGGLAPSESQVRRDSTDDEPYVTVYDMMLGLLLGLGMWSRSAPRGRTPWTSSSPRFILLRTTLALEKPRNGT